MNQQNETINGLHSCQPQNEPKEGQIKSFVVLNMPSKGTKKAWLKIKSESREKGGSPYMILSVQPTGYKDDYGNVSFNLEIEPVDQPQNAPRNVQQASPAHPEPKSDRNGIGYVRERLRQAVALYNECVDQVDANIKPKINDCTAELYQAAIGTLFIWATRAGLEDAMPKAEKEQPF